ncbi:MAG: hypothetical protein WC511_02045 [Candidatus Pacearchaeota archaeon]
MVSKINFVFEFPETLGDFMQDLDRDKFFAIQDVEGFSYPPKIMKECRFEEVKE